MKIKLCDIRRGLQHRAINESTIKALMESLPAAGQISPIIIKEAGIMRERLESGYLLIAGNHRLTAAERLGWDTIEADVWPADTHAVRLELIEVDENLCRAELTAAEKAKAIQVRKILWDSLREQESGTQSSTLTGRGHIGFASSTAAITGMSKKNINQYLKIAETLGDALEDLQGTEADTKTQLLKLAEAAEEARAVMLHEAIKTEAAQESIIDKKTTTAKHSKTPDESDYKKVANRIIREFNRLPEKHKQFLREVLFPT